MLFWLCLWNDHMLIIPDYTKGTGNFVESKVGLCLTHI